MAFTHQLQLPRTTRRDLRAVLRHQLDRLTPFRSDELYFDYRILDDDRASGMLTVEIVAAPKEVVHEALAPFEEAGVTVEVVDVERPADEDPDDAPEPGEINLLPHDKLKPRHRVAKRLTWGLAAANVVLLLGLALAPLALEWRDERRLAAAVETARQQAAVVLRLEERAADLEAEVGVLQALRARRQDSLAALTQLTELLPDDSWLEQATLRDGELALRGQSAEAARLIPLFEASAAFDAAAFRAPVIRLADSGRERFSMTVALTGAAP